MISHASSLVLIGMLVLPLVVAGMIAVAIVWVVEPARRRRALVLTDVVAAAWLAVPAFVALRGWLALFDREPPPFMLLMVVLLAATLTLAFSKLGTALAHKLPLAVLVGAQGFRLPLELVMHQAYDDGLMPVQMSYSGHNFDIVTGITALVVAVLIAKGNATRGLVLAWNVMGTVLLFAIMAIAISSTPTFAAYGPHQLNTWVAHFPYVWLPSVLVPSALLGHVLVFRRLAADKQSSP